MLNRFYYGRPAYSRCGHYIFAMWFLKHFRKTSNKIILFFFFELFDKNDYIDLLITHEGVSGKSTLWRERVSMLWMPVECQWSRLVEWYIKTRRNLLLGSAKRRWRSDTDNHFCEHKTSPSRPVGNVCRSQKYTMYSAILSDVRTEAFAEELMQNSSYSKDTVDRSAAITVLMIRQEFCHRWTARRFVSRSTCCKPRRAFSVINLRRSNLVDNTVHCVTKSRKTGKISEVQSLGIRLQREVPLFLKIP